MSDVFAHLPLLPEDLSALTAGSYLHAATEDKFMEYVWRLRRWNLYGDVILKYDFSPFDEFTVINSPGPGYINNGENNVDVTAAFSSVDDILCNWRQTRSQSTGAVIDEGSGESDPSFDLWWGPRGTYDPGSGGTLDSFFWVEKKPNGDEFFQITSDPDYDASFRLSAAFLTFDPDGVDTGVDLYETDSDRFHFEGEFILKPGALYWPWVIAGTPTYDTATGAQLASPTRLDTNGSPLCYFAQQA